MKKMFSIPEYTASKDEEVEFLRKLEGSLVPNTYIASLINPDLIDWFRWRVRDDVSCNIVGELQTMTMKYNDYAWKIKAADTANASLERQIVDLRAELDDTKKEAEEQHRRVGELMIDHQEAEEVWQAELAEEITRANYIAEDLAHERDVLANEVLRLKAKLYDLTNKD